MRKSLVVTAAALAIASSVRAQDLPVGSGRFERAEAAGATSERQEVYYHRPATWGVTGRIVVVMHGASRDPDRYRDEW